MTTGKRSPRWAFMEALDIGADNDPYLDRLRLVQTPWFGVYLHHIHRPDLDRDPHDHPWAFASLVLTGGYDEAVWPDKTDLSRWIIRTRTRWTLKSLGQGAAHKITDVARPLWTLVLVGPRRSDWGFWTPDGFVGWRDYDYAKEPGHA